MGRKSTKIRKPRLVEIREPNGQLSRSQAAQEENPYAPTKLKRMRDAAMKGMGDEQWGSELGMLQLERKITIEMYAAGKWWRDMAAQYRSAINSPAQHPRAASLGQSNGGTQSDPDTYEGRKRVTKDQRAVEAFQAAHAALLGAGAFPEKITRNLCELDIRPIGIYEMDAACRGLLWLSNWRKLTNSP